MRRGSHKGFTLPEVLVTIAIVATLAAVLLPALNSQLTKGEASRASNDLLAVQTAINTFVSDVRRYPRTLAQLTSPITGQQDIRGNPYPGPLVARWKGPYLAKELTTSSTLITGFGAEVQTNFSESPTYNGIKYVQVDVLPIPQTEDFDRLDQIIDDVSNSSSGQLRYSAASSGVASFYAVPIQ